MDKIGKLWRMEQTVLSGTNLDEFENMDWSIEE